MRRSFLTRVEDSLTSVLTLTEGVEQTELLRSRLTRQEVRRHLLEAACALREVGTNERQAAAELDFEAWAAGASMLAAGPREAQDAALWSFVCERVPETASWLRIYRSRSPQLFAMPQTSAPLLHPTLSAFLREHGFNAHDLDAPGAHGLTPLMRAALQGRLDLVDALIERDVSINARNDDGNNALWLACVAGNPEVVQRLVSAGIDRNNQNETGATTLMYAASAGKDEMVALLLKLGADPWVENQDGARAVDMASSYGCLAQLRFTAR